MRAAASAPAAWGTLDPLDEATWPILICLLGDVCVLAAGRPVALPCGTKAEALLCALGARPGRGVEREALLCALWPDHEPQLAGQSLNALVHQVHTLLGPALGGARPLTHTGGHYRLNAAAGVGTDVACFTALAAAGAQYGRAGDQEAAVAAYEHAVRLYRGDLCGGADSKLVAERDCLRNCYLTLLMRLAAQYLTTGDDATCLRYAQMLLFADPCREDGHRLLMRCYLLRGERAAALRQYRRCAEVLRAEFDAAPEPATTLLFDRIRCDPGSV